MIFWSKLKSLFSRRKIDAEMVEEMRQHLERRTQSNRAAGLSSDEADYAARRQFGGVDQLKEIAREQRGWWWIEHLRQDVRQGWRQIRRRPGFAFIVMTILALGIGANTAVFSALDLLLLRSLPVREPGQLMLVGNIRAQGAGTPVPSYFLSPSLYQLMSDRLQSFNGIAALNSSSGTRALIPTSLGRNEVIRVRSSDVSGNYFSLLQVSAFLGRLLLPEDDRRGAAHAVAVLSYDCWQAQFGGDRNVLGKTVLIENISFEIVGVAPRRFSGVKAGESVEVWTPLHMLPLVNPRLGADLVAQGWGWNGLFVFGRLRSGVAPEAAAAELEVISQQQMAELRPEVAPADRPRVLGKMVLEPGRSGFESDARRKGGPLLGVLLAVVVLVQVIACANVASLSLARFASRRRELAARASLGAGRGRLVRQLLTETLLLVAGGAAGGLMLAYWGFVAARAHGLPVYPSGSILLFVLVLSGLTGVIVALVPALLSSRIDLVSALKNQGGGLAGGSRQGVLKTMVMVQLAVSGCLIAGTGYLVRTVQNLQQVELGFRTENLLVVNLTLPRDYEAARRTRFAQDLLQRVGGLPGVSQVTFATGGLLGGGWAQGRMDVEGYVPGREEDMTGHFVFTGPNFFETIGLPLVRGRGLASGDIFVTSRPAVEKTVINEAVARRFFGNADPIGRHLNWGVGKFEIVGVVKNAKYRLLREEAPLICYVPEGSVNSSVIALQIRAIERPQALAASVASLVKQLDPNVRVQPPETMSDVMARATQEERLIAGGVGLFSGLALLLTSLGLYGLLAYNVAQRTKEIGVRLALGGRAGDIVVLIVRQGLALTLIGWAVGGLAAIGLVRIISNRLYGVSAWDPVTLLGTGGLLLAVALLASGLPARRATKVDPMVALRTE